MGSIRSIEEDRSLAAIETSQSVSDPGATGLRVTAQTLPDKPPVAPIPSWLWWNVLSADAPVVAAAWALLFAHASKVALPVANVVVLALTVWLIYMADRLMDGWGTADKGALQARHCFWQRHRALALGMAGLAAVSGAWLAREELSAAVAKAGLLLGGFVAAYLLCVHTGGRADDNPVSRLMPKELAVGFLFAAGTTLPVWSHRGAFSRDALITWLLFGLVCALNCVAIECWEHGPKRKISGKAASLAAWADSRIGGLAAALTLVAWLAYMLFRTNGTVSAAIGSAAMLILLLNLARERLSIDALRVLVDVALLIPAVFALAVRR